MTTILPRRGTAAQWTAANPVLAMGEEGYETDTTRWKRGDGTTAWTELSYYQPSWNDVTAKPAVIAAGADQAAARVAIGAAALSGVVSRGDLVINVKDYGAIGDGLANDTAAINNAIAALTPGATLYFPVGRYMTSGGHTITIPSVRIVGPTGRAQTYNSSAQLFLRNASNSDMLILSGASQVTIRDLTLHGNKDNQTGVSRGIVTSPDTGANYLLMDSVWVTSFNGNGFDIDSSGTISATIVNCESRMNNGYGMRFPGGATDTIVSTCYIDQNGLSGIMCSSGDLSVSDTHIWGNGLATSGDRDGITFQSSSGCRVVNCFIETNRSGAGIRFKTGNNRGHLVIGCDLWENGLQGIYAFNATNCVFANNIVRDNNYLNATNIGGIVVNSCTSIVVEGNQFFNTVLNRQRFCFIEEGSSVYITFLGNSCRRGAQNGQGTISVASGTSVDLGSIFRYKTTDQSVVNSTTLVNDDSFSFPAVVGEAWELEGLMFVEGPPTGDISLRINGPSGSSGFWRAFGPAGSATSDTSSGYVASARGFGSSMGVGLFGAGTVVPVKLEGLITITTDGNVIVMFGQSTADAQATIVKAGSYLRARRVAI